MKILTKLNSLIEGSPIKVDFSELYPSWIVVYKNNKLQLHYSKNILAFGAIKGQNSVSVFYFKTFLPRYRKFTYHAKPLKSFKINIKQSQFSLRQISDIKFLANHSSLKMKFSNIIFNKSKYFLSPLNIKWFNTADFKEFKLINKE